MPPDTVLIIVLSALGASAAPILLWLRAQKRIRDLEMTLLMRTTDAEQFDELRSLVERLAAQTEQLVEQQSILAARLGERRDPAVLPRPEQARPITPH